MTDQAVTILPAGRKVLIVAVVLTGAIWAAWRVVWPVVCPSEAPVSGTAATPACSPSATSDAFSSSPPVEPEQAPWLPPLSPETRTVFAAFPLVFDPIRNPSTTSPLERLPFVFAPVAAGRQARQASGSASTPQTALPIHGQHPAESLKAAASPAAQPTRTFRPAQAADADNPVTAPEQLPSPVRDAFGSGRLAAGSIPLDPDAPLWPGLDRLLRELPLRDQRPGAGPPQNTSTAPSKGVALPLASYDSANRSPELEAIANEADMHSRNAFMLAGRGAYYAARAEFIMALRLIAQGLDGQYRTNMHSRALAAGLTALKEVEDLFPDRWRLEGDLDLTAIVARHHTPVLHGASLDGLTPLRAAQSYLTFAQEQLGTAGAKEVAASIALYGLGKLYSYLAVQAAGTSRAAAPKAMVFYQSALLVNPRHYLASNDLGVLLARAGRFEDARAALEHSAGLSRQWETWHNLARVYRQLGQLPCAQYAEQQVAAIRRELAQRSGGGRGSSGLVQWVDPAQFAQFAASPPPGEPKAQTIVPNPGAPPGTAGNVSVQRSAKPLIKR